MRAGFGKERQIVLLSRGKERRTGPTRRRKHDRWMVLLMNVCSFTVDISLEVKESHEFF